MSDQQPSILDFMRLFPQFNGPTWDVWRVVLAAIFRLPLSPEQAEIFRALTGRPIARLTEVLEVWMACGRRAGKSIIASLIAVYLTTCRSYRLAAGERGLFIVISADRKQSRVVRRYVGALLHSSPVLEALIVRETQDVIDLSTGISIEIHTASFRSVRGYTVIGAVCDEIAFWPTDESTNPDSEILAALRPAMATVPDALLLALSSPYAKKGELYRAYRDSFGRDGDPVLVVKAPTRTLNPTVPQHVIDRAMAKDPESARAEYLAEFRSDVSAFVSQEAIDQCVVAGRLELPFDGRHEAVYVAFVDAAGGSGTDSFTLAIAHVENHDGHAVAVIDAVRETRPPFSPESVVSDYAKVLTSYRIAHVVGDRFGGEFPRERFSKAGVGYLVSEQAKSDLYRDFLPVLNSGRLELLDHSRLLVQLAGLERRVARGGRDSIDHAPGGHDDISNVCAGVVLEALRYGTPAVAPVLDVHTELPPFVPQHLAEAFRRTAVANAARARDEAARRNAVCRHDSDPFAWADDER